MTNWSINDPSNLSSEPDWMPQSGQVSEAELAEVLVREYYDCVYRLALSILKNKEQAQEITLQTFTWAVANRHHFWGEVNLATWVFYRAYRFIVQQKLKNNLAGIFHHEDRNTEKENPWLAFINDLPEAQRAALLLHSLPRLNSSEIAYILKRSPRWVHLSLVKYRQSIIPLIVEELPAPVFEPATAPHPHILEDLQLAQDGLLDSASRQILTTHLSSCSACRAYASWTESLEALTRRHIEQSLPAPELTQEQQHDLAGEVEKLVCAQWQRRGASIPVKEILIALVMVILIGALAWTSGIFAPAPELSLAEQRQTRAVLLSTPLGAAPSFVGVFPVTTGLPLDLNAIPTQVTPPPPLGYLSLHSSQNEIRRQIQESTSSWSTLWEDALIIDYGPLGYAGPAQEYHNRIWASQPDRLLALGGPPEGDPDYIRIAVAANYYELDPLLGVGNYPNPVDYARSEHASDVLLSYVHKFADRNRLYGLYLSDMVFRPNSVYLPGGELKITGEETYLERRVLVVDNVLNGVVLDHFRIDEVTGLLLSWRSYNRYDYSLVDRDIYITNLALDTGFPQGFFAIQPEKKHLKWNDIWTPVTNIPTPSSAHGDPRQGPVSMNPAGFGFDPAQARLTFAFTSLSAPSGSQTALIEANGKILGEVNMGDPLGLLCRRSPDGSIIAFIDQPDLPFYASVGIRWLRLIDVNHVHNPFPDGLVSSYLSFSPDNRTMAFFGCSQKENCGVFVQDLVTMHTRKLLSTIVAAYFAWSPDSKYLAMIGATDMSAMHTIVADVSTGETIYTGPFNWNTNSPAADSPTNNWNVPFPVEMQGLEGCVFPPNK